ncbi:alpha/beta hydrolase [Maribacter antarcticus]|uniref:alpha/beta hydrolase n=1 Tax=Maribacter antarcticus TaxID=505250 RepID=UPI00068491E7|nr:alpha/beta fold hydrolase [Maribacter antarcticus]
MTIVAKFSIGIVLTISLSALAQHKNDPYKRVETEIIKLIYSPDPAFDPNIVQQPMSPEVIADIGFEQVYQNSPREFSMRDGKHLFSYAYKKESDTTIILVHGVLSGAYMMNKTAGLLQETTHNDVIALDFRGHGQSEGTPGDVDYVNQYVDDLEDVVSAIKKEKPNQSIVLAGHSMGGGIILRYAMEKDAPEVDGYLLFAPHLGANAPTLKEEALETGEAPFVKLHINRIIGLKMLNAIGVTKYNNLPVLFFNLPETMPVTKYSYRANESMSPSDYKEGLNAIAKPLLVLIGSEDEVFDARKFNTAITENSNGEVYTVEDETHNGIRHNKKAMELISNWINHHTLQ